MPPPPPVQREAVSGSIVTVLAALAARSGWSTLAVRTKMRAVPALTWLRLRVRLAAAGDEGWQPLNILIIIVLKVLLARLTVLRLGRLMVLFARLEGLLSRLSRRKRFAAHGRLLVVVVVSVVASVTARIAALLLLIIGLALPKLFLRRRDQAKVMFGVLIVILGCNRVTGTLRIAGELKIFFGDVRCRSPNFYVRPVGLVHTRQRILMVMAAAFAVTTSHALVLSVSHDLLIRQPPHFRQRGYCRFRRTEWDSCVKR